MIICQDCGWSNRENACFCARCGVRLNAIDAEVSAAAPKASGQATRPLLIEHDQVLETLEPGSLLQQRFQIVQQLEETPETRTFRAIDLDRCANCGALCADEPDGFCAECGAATDAPCFVRIVEQRHQEPPPHDEHLTVGERDYFVTIERPMSVQRERTDWAVLRVGLRTDTGAQRKVNEDAIDSRVYERTGERRLGLFVVADGLGGRHRARLPAGSPCSTSGKRSTSSSGRLPCWDNPWRAAPTMCWPLQLWQPTAPWPPPEQNRATT